MSGFIIEKLTIVQKNNLLGFAVVQMPSGMVLSDVGVHRQGDTYWASPASKPMLGRDGTQLKDASEKLRRTPIVSFKDKQARDKWSAAVIAALKEQKPAVLT
jgi:hypothetical protein